MKQTKQSDLFDQAGAIQPGNRQIDLEQIIEEKRVCEEQDAITTPCVQSRKQTG
jgi:hypothetical protein